jgi:glioma pathogenesis-related protein 2
MTMQYYALFFVLATVGYINVHAKTYPYDSIGVLAHINVYRRVHQVGDLSLDDKISSFSQSWTDELVRVGFLKHSTSDYGENLAQFWSASKPTDVTKYIKDSIDMWYNEVLLYDFNKPGYKDTTGHFTQVVWKDSQRIGIGVSWSEKTGHIFVCMNYDPPGNSGNSGRYVLNVLPKKVSSLSPSPTVVRSLPPPPKLSPPPRVVNPPPPLPPRPNPPARNVVIIVRTAPQRSIPKGP